MKYRWIYPDNYFERSHAATLKCKVALVRYSYWSCFITLENKTFSLLSRRYCYSIIVTRQYIFHLLPVLRFQWCSWSPHEAKWDHNWNVSALKAMPAECYSLTAFRATRRSRSDHRCERHCPRLLRVPGGWRETCHVRDVLITQECQSELCLCAATPPCKPLKEMSRLQAPLLSLIRPFIPTWAPSLVTIRSDSAANRWVKWQCSDWSPHKESRAACDDKWQTNCSLSVD